MVLAQPELAGRAHHAVGFDAADGGDLEQQPSAGNGRARSSEHAEHPGARIGSAAHDLHRAFTGIDGQDLQFVGLRVLVGGQHPGDPERRQRFGRVGQLLDLEPDRGQLVGDLLGRGVGVEVVLQPRKGEFHAPTPPERVGTWSARKL
jgi:hypothetical protein